jgi:hypothetical protein
MNTQKLVYPGTFDTDHFPDNFSVFAAIVCDQQSAFNKNG